MVPFEFERGETIVLALDCMAGDPAMVSGVTAKLKAVAPGQSAVAAGTPVAAVFQVSARAGAEDEPGGWLLSIDAGCSAALKAGSYRADAAIAVNGGVIVTEQVAIRIGEPVSVP